MKNSNKRDFYKIYVSEDNEMTFTTDLNFKCEDYSKPRLAVIEQGIEYLPDNTFAFCDRLEKVVISECVTEIPNGIFYGCKSLRACLKSSNKYRYESKNSHLQRNRKFSFTIFPQTSIFFKPSKRTFNNPSFG